MNEEIEKAIKHLAARIPDAADSGDSMKLSQSVTNLAHALDSIREPKNGGGGGALNCEGRQPYMGASFQMYLAEAKALKRISKLQFIVRLPMGHGYSDYDLAQKIKEIVAEPARKEFGENYFRVEWKAIQVLG